MGNQCKRALMREINAARSKVETYGERHRRNYDEGSCDEACKKCKRIKDADEELETLLEKLRVLNTAQEQHNLHIIDKRKAEKMEVKKMKVTKINWGEVSPREQEYLVASYILGDVKAAKLANFMSTTAPNVYKLKQMAKEKLAEFKILTDRGQCPYPEVLESLKKRKAALGGAVKAEAKSQNETDLASDVAALNLSLSIKDKQIIQKDMEIEHLNTDLAEQQTIISGLNGQLADADELLIKTEKECQEARERLDTELALVIRLEKELKATQYKLNASELHVDELKKQNDTLRDRAEYHEADKEKALMELEKQYQKDLFLERQDREEQQASQFNEADVRLIASINRELISNLYSRMGVADDE